MPLVWATERGVGQTESLLATAGKCGAVHYLMPLVKLFWKVKPQSVTAT